MSEERKFLIYMHTSPSGKSYIGQTCNLTRRNYSHQSGSGCRLFGKAVNKYGWDNFSHQVLIDNLTIEEANLKEAELIAFHETRAPNGYNLKAGGLSSLHSGETRALMSESAKKVVRSPDLGKKISATKQSMSPERKAEIAEKIRQANIGKKYSDETKAKQSAARKGRKMSPEAVEKSAASRRGRVVSAETRARQSAATKGREGFNKGVPLTEATKEKLRASLQNTNSTEETKKRRSEANKAAWERRRLNGTANHSPEHRAKIGASNKSKKEAAQGDLFREQNQTITL